jgi:hypothetical protein
LNKTKKFLSNYGFFRITSHHAKKATTHHRPQVEPCLNTPKATTVTSSEVDVGCGHFKGRIKPEKRNNYSDKGKQILSIENTLSQSPLATD